MGDFQGEPSDIKASVICSDLSSGVQIESYFLISYLYKSVFFPCTDLLLSRLKIYCWCSLGSLESVASLPKVWRHRALIHGLEFNILLRYIVINSQDCRHCQVDSWTFIRRKTSLIHLFDIFWLILFPCEDFYVMILKGLLLLWLLLLWSWVVPYVFSILITYAIKYKIILAYFS